MPEGTHGSTVAPQRLPRWAPACLIAVLTAAGVAAGLVPLRPPAAEPADAPADRFSSARAWAHLQHVAARPHPVGSDEHERVRRYVVDQIGRLGLEAQVQEERVLVRREDGRLRAAEVRNVLTRLSGTAEGGPAVLLAAHYDSVPTSPGAGDDGAAVAALLEVLRALRAGSPPRHDVIFLFSDGEEIGMMGARAFAERHPWAADVGLTLNFEARGAAGPSILFETAGGSAAAVDLLARRAPHPMAYSYSGEVYRYLGHRTDLTVLRDLGAPALNFAFISKPFAYHTSWDRLEELSERSVQHHGSHALALARDPDSLRSAVPEDGGAAVFWTLPGGFLVRYPEAWAGPLGLVGALVALFAFWRGLRSSRLRPGGLAVGLGVVVVGLVLVGPAAGLLQGLVVMLGGPPQRIAALTTGLSLLTAAGVLATFGLVRRWASPSEIAGAGLVLWAVGTLVVGFVVPGASYLFTWPLLLGALSLALPELSGAASGASRSAGLGSALGLGVAGGTILLLWAPVLGLASIALGGGDRPYLMALVLLLVVLLLPQKAGIAGGSGRAAGAAIWALCLGGALALGVAAAGPEVPRSSSLLFFQDADSGDAWWVSFDARWPPWAAERLDREPEVLPLSDFFEVGRRGVLAASAPGLPVRGPSVLLVGEEVDGDGSREIIVEIASGEEILRMFLRSEDEITDLLVGGWPMEVPDGAGPVRLDYYAPSPDGLELAIRTAGTAPVDLTVLEQSFGLPSADGRGSLRPGDEVANPVWLSDSTFVRRTVRF